MKQTEIMKRMTEADQAGNTALAAAYAAMGETLLALRSTKRQLADSATSAMMRLEKLVQMTDAYDPETDAQPPHWNALGTLQGLGSEIDRLGGEATLLVKMLGTMRTLAQSLEEAK
jgi:hypothetical protein